MGLIPGQIFRDVIGVELKGVLVNATLPPLVQVIYNETPISVLDIPVAVALVTTGVYSVIFDTPSDWNHGDRVSLLVEYEYLGRPYSQLHRLGIVEADIEAFIEKMCDRVDLLGYSPGLPLTLDNSLGTGTLPDGRRFTKVTVGDVTVVTRDDL